VRLAFQPRSRADHATRNNEATGPARLRHRLVGPHLVAIAASLSVFGILGFELEVTGPGGFAWERRMTHLLVSHWRDRPFGDIHMSTQVGGMGLVILALVFPTWALLARRWRDALVLAGSPAVVALTPALKALFGRPQPFHPGAEPYSFPSGHAVGTMAIAAAVLTVLWGSRLRWVALVSGAVFVLAVGAVVVAQQGHWPSDVLAGWALAVAWVATLSSLARATSRDLPQTRA
jgi:membrane-associated phospholipid phosphatase